MLVWRNKTRTPLGGWRFFQKETNTMVKGAHWNDLILKVAGHRSANNLPIEPGWERELEEYMCSQFEDACDEVDQGKAPTINMGAVMQFTKIIGEAIIKGNSCVEKDEAYSRAAICSNCPSNVEPEGCAPCGIRNVANLLTKLIGSKETPHDNRLNSCKHCGCLNKAQVWFPLELLQKHMSDKVNKDLPNNCWKKK